MLSFLFKVYRDLRAGEKGNGDIIEMDLSTFLVKCKFQLNCTINVFEQRKICNNVKRTLGSENETFVGDKKILLQESKMQVKFSWAGDSWINVKSYIPLLQIQLWGGTAGILHFK